jgi:hypothetical protein
MAKLGTIQGDVSPVDVVSNIVSTFAKAASMLKTVLARTYAFHLESGAAAIWFACKDFRDSAVRAWGVVNVRCPNFTCFLDFWRQAVRFGPVFYISGRMGEQSHLFGKLV